jgi:hypothetical protein
MVKVCLCAAGLALFATGCAFDTEEFRTVSTERSTDPSVEDDAGATDAPEKEPEQKKGKQQKEDD